MISNTRPGSLRGEKHSKILTRLAHKKRPPFSLQQSSQLLPFQLSSLPCALAAPLFLQLRQTHAEPLRPRAFEILCRWWIKHEPWNFSHEYWSKRYDAPGYEFFNFLQDRRVQIQWGRGVFPLQHVGNLSRLHNISVRDPYGRTGVGCGRWLVGRDTEGFEGRGEIRILDPFGLVGYTFEIEYQPSCQTTVSIFRP